MSIQPVLETPDLLLHPDFVDEKQMMVKYLNKAVETIVNQNQHRREAYFIVFHERSDLGVSKQKISISLTLPSFITNQIVFWVSNQRGICEWLWTVPPRQKGKTLKPEFNTTGVAYLQAKGAMPS